MSGEISYVKGGGGSAHGLYLDNVICRQFFLQLLSLLGIDRNVEWFGEFNFV